MSEKIDGKWFLDYKSTLEYRDPGRKIDTFEDNMDFIISFNTTTFDVKNKTVSNDVSGKSTIGRYRVINDSKDKVTLDISGSLETLEFFKKDVLIMCPALGGINKCIALKRNKLRN